MINFPSASMTLQTSKHLLSRHHPLSRRGPLMSKRVPVMIFQQPLENCVARPSLFFFFTVNCEIKQIFYGSNEPVIHNSLISCSH